MGEPPLVSLNQRPLSSAFLHQALLLPPIHSNFPLLIRTFFQLSVAGSGLRGVVHARQPLAQYRAKERTRLGGNGPVRERMHASSSSFGAYWQGRSRIIAS